MFQAQDFVWGLGYDMILTTIIKTLNVKIFYFSKGWCLRLYLLDDRFRASQAGVFIQL